jgi:hypothetical protein
MIRNIDDKLFVHFQKLRLIRMAHGAWGMV